MSLEIANTIRKQLYAFGSMKVMSWGANAWTGGKDFLAFKVQGFKLKGVVKITLKGNDTYTIEFFKGRYNATSVAYKTLEGMYFDQLTEVIDLEVEYTGADYEERVKNAKYHF